MVLRPAAVCDGALDGLFCFVSRFKLSIHPVHLFARSSSLFCIFPSRVHLTAFLSAKSQRSPRHSRV